MQIGILGSLQVHNGAVAVEIAGSRLRALTIRLALDAGRAVSATALVDAIWGDQPPADEANALQSLVSRLRRALGGPNTIRQSPAGYLLAVNPSDVDANVFRQLAQRGRVALRERDAAGAARQLREALALGRSRRCGRPGVLDRAGHAVARPALECAGRSGRGRTQPGQRRRDRG
jgi:DNA-binding SARP family transcriptional activator